MANDRLNEVKAQSLFGIAINEKAGVKTALVPEGIGFDADKVCDWILHDQPTIVIGETYLDYTDTLKKVETDLNQAANLVKVALLDFRSRSTNDMASIKSVADKANNEVRKLKEQLGQVISMLTSTEMEAAVDNAERLATALANLNEAKASKFAFAVIDASKSKKDDS
jgi:hypothetical protein